MIVGIHHIGLHVADLDRTVDFYRRGFGFQPVAREMSWAGVKEVDAAIGVPGSAARSVMLNAGPCNLEVLEFSYPPARRRSPARASDRGYTHLCVTVTDIDAEFYRLVAEGMDFVMNKPADFGDIRSVYGHDPDGNLIEIKQIADHHAFSLAKRVSPRARAG